MSNAPQSALPEKSRENASPSKPTASLYVFSLPWFLGGLLSLIAVGSVVGGVYYYRYVNMTSHFLDVAKQLMKEAEVAKEKADNAKKEGKPADEVQKMADGAYDMKRKVADMLNSYRNARPDDVQVLTNLSDVLENLMADRPTGRTRSEILNVSKKLLGLVQDSDSLKYRKRILELEWENGDLNAVMERAGEVLGRTGGAGSNDYEAWRYLTLATLQRLAVNGYKATPIPTVNLPPSMDELLDKVYRMKPEDIDIAVSYADFVRDKLRGERALKEFREASSATLRDMSDADRAKKADGIINDMVNRNAEDARAYLVRYRYKVKYELLAKDNTKIDPDLEQVLKLEPGNSDALIYAGLLAYQQSLLGLRNGDTKLAADRKTAAENYFKTNVQENPRNSAGYQYLGDFYSNEGNLNEAVRVWKDCLDKNKTSINQEIIGRLVRGLIEQKKLDDAADTLALLDSVIKENRIANPLVSSRIRNLIDLLSARLYDSQAIEATQKADAATSAGQLDEAKKFYAISQKKTADASQILDRAFSSFGKSPYDYMTDPASIHSRLIGESLMLAGRLAADRGAWDVAVTNYQKAMPFGKYRDAAALACALAYQQLNKPKEATDLLAKAVEANPDNMPLRYIYTQSLFRQEMSQPNPASRNLDAVEKELRQLEAHKDQLAQPWAIDLRLIQLELMRNTASANPDDIVKAQLAAVKKYRALEKGEFPAAKEGEPKRSYCDDMGFLTELAGIYSGLNQFPDLDRILLLIRDMKPDGEAQYFVERVNDALRRNDREGAIAVVDEAMADDKLTSAQKQRFAVFMERLKDNTPKSMDKMYAQLKSTYDLNPDSLKPQGFFSLANMALDRGDIEYAKPLLGRLEKIEGAPELGTMWRFIKARLLLLEKDPSMDAVKQLQEEIATRRADWDMTYILKAMIDERALAATPDNKDLKRKLTEVYAQSLRCGNIQPIIWNRLLALYEELDDFDKARKLQQDAVVRGVRLEAASGQFPQPYQKLFDQVHAAVLSQDQPQADLVAKQCLMLAQNRRENPELIYSLNFQFGKLFVDNNMLPSAKRHLGDIAKRGGTYVYPLAVCYAKDKKVDEGFTLILDEIDRMPSSMSTLLPSMLILLAQVKPSEPVFVRMEKLINKIENGERPSLQWKITENGSTVPFPNGDRRIKTMTVRFPDLDTVPDPKTIEFLPPTTVEPNLGDEQ